MHSRGKHVTITTQYTVQLLSLIPMYSGVALDLDYTWCLLGRTPTSIIFVPDPISGHNRFLTSSKLHDY